MVTHKGIDSITTKFEIVK